MGRARRVCNETWGRKVLVSQLVGASMMDGWNRVGILLLILQKGKSCGAEWARMGWDAQGRLYDALLLHGV